MSGSRAALLVGAGDAIGAGVARRFAVEGYRVCIARRDVAKGAASARRGRWRPLVGMFEPTARRRAPGSASTRSLPNGSNATWDLYGSQSFQRRCKRSETTARRHQANCSSRHGSWPATAGFLVGREATRCMLRHGRGTMLFTGATASVRGGKGFAAFAGAKFGLRAIAQSMARELGPKNIHVVHLILDGAGEQCCDPQANEGTIGNRAIADTG